jgi:hypothetical protein
VWCCQSLWFFRSGTRLDGSQTAAQGRGEGFGFGDKQRTCKQLKNKNGLGEE